MTKWTKRKENRKERGTTRHWTVVFRGHLHHYFAATMQGQNNRAKLACTRQRQSQVHFKAQSTDITRATALPEAAFNYFSALKKRTLNTPTKVRNDSFTARKTQQCSITGTFTKQETLVPYPEIGSQQSLQSVTNSQLKRKRHIMTNQYVFTKITNWWQRAAAEVMPKLSLCTKKPRRTNTTKCYQVKQKKLMTSTSYILRFS